MRRLLLPALFSLLAGSSVWAQAPSSGASYVVTQNDKTTGSAQYSTRPIAGGEMLQSSGSLHIAKFSYSFNNTETVDAQGNLVRDSLTGSVHGQKASGNHIQFDTNSSASGRDFSIRINADGKQTTNTVDRHRNTVLMPDLDPAAYALMARIALQQPKTAWVLIPKQNGILVPADYQLLPDLHGTLNGHNLTVKHSAAAISMENSIVVELFYTASGDLLEADLNSQGLRVTQSGFKLLNRPKPVAPPAGAPPSQGQGQQGPSQPGPGQNGQPMPPQQQQPQQQQPY